MDGENIFSPCSLVIAENFLSTQITYSGSDKLDHIKSPPGFSDVYGYFLYSFSYHFTSLFSPFFSEK